MLNLEANIDNPDLFYKTLAQLYSGRTVEESLLISSKLILLLANHIGSEEILFEAIDIAATNIAES